MEEYFKWKLFLERDLWILVLWFIGFFIVVSFFWNLIENIFKNCKKCKWENKHSDHCRGCKYGDDANHYRYLDPSDNFCKRNK